MRVGVPGRRGAPDAAHGRTSGTGLVHGQVLQRHERVLVSSEIGVGSARREFWYGLDRGVGASSASLPQLGPRRRRVELLSLGARRGLLAMGYVMPMSPAHIMPIGS